MLANKNARRAQKPTHQQYCAQKHTDLGIDIVDPEDRAMRKLEDGNKGAGVERDIRPHQMMQLVGPHQRKCHQRHNPKQQQHRAARLARAPTIPPCE